MRYAKAIAFTSLLACLLLFSAVTGWGRGASGTASDKSLTALTQDEFPDAGDLRHAAVHDAGNLFHAFINGLYSTGQSPLYVPIDPETGAVLPFTTYPAGSDMYSIYSGSVWIGGIVDDDTLVTVGYDGWVMSYEMMPEDVEAGGVYRTGNFADDEFVTATVDTVFFDPYDTQGHQPMGIELTHRTYSWADTLYDDFVIVEYTLTNVGDNFIHDGWVGLFLDNDVFHASNPFGYADDCTEFLDTLLYDGDPSSRVLIPYSFDNDGDPEGSPSAWAATSPRGAISARLLGADFDIEGVNFNWWIPNGNAALDFGPRLAGTPEDPFREFDGGVLGTPVSDGDKYYMLSHAEVDYGQLTTAVDHSGDGWLPPPLPSFAVDFADGFDTRFLLSFGDFSLAAGESVHFAVALVAADGLHVNASDFADLFDAYNPQPYQDALDKSELLLHHRRAEEVYQSGLTLPWPGPPVGLEVVEFDDETVTLAWQASGRPDLEEYVLKYRYPDADSVWYVWDTTADTEFVVNVVQPQQMHEFAVATKALYMRTSGLSLPVEVIPAMPDPPENVTATLDGLVPLIGWDLPADTTVESFVVYRAVWDAPLEKYDSTESITFADNFADPGYKYRYAVSAKNSYGFESAISDVVSAAPMAMDEGILVYDLSRKNNAAYELPHLRDAFERLFESFALRLPVTLKQDEFITPTLQFHEMSKYSVVIIGMESRLGGLNDAYNHTGDTLAEYLAGGGRAIFMALNAALEAPANETNRFVPGDFQYDILKLDSCVSYDIYFDQATQMVPGDLMGCQSQQGDYETLTADLEKLAQEIIPFDGYIPMSGYMFPRPEAEVLYTYISSNTDTASHGQVNGIRYLGEDYRFVLLNFPLSLMEEAANFRVMEQALLDMGVDVYCGDANDDGAVNVGDVVYLIRYVFVGGPPPEHIERGDVDCSGDIDVADAVTVINYIFKDHALLRCCP